MAEEEKAISFLKEFSQTCFEIGKSPEDIIILGASKSQDINSIESAFNLGIKHFGENFLQESEHKIKGLKASPTWHFIGSVQSRKAKKISSLFQWVQTLDRLKVAKKLNENRPQYMGKLNVCIQVNPDNEKNKSGIPLSDCEGFLSELLKLDQLKVRGIMSIPKATNNFRQQRRVFGKIRSCFENLKDSYPELDTLSMGMSGDYKAAILEGSTMIRIGTSIFGQRK